MARTFVVLVLCSSACSFTHIPDLTSGLSRDGGAGVDIEHDAGEVGDAGTLPFCDQAKHALCDDFDRDQEPSPDWSHATVTASSQSSITKTRAVSPPASLRCSTPSLATDAAIEYASLVREHPGPWRRVVVELDANVERPAWQTGSSNLGLVCIGLYSGANEIEGSCMSFSSLGSGLSWPGGGGRSDAPIPYDTWFHVRIDFDPTTGRVAAQIGDAAITGAFAPMDASADPEILVQVGLQAYNKPVPAVTAYVDNVTVDFP